MLRRLRKWKYRVALAVIVMLLALFTARTYDAYKALIEKTVYGKADIHSIRGWMNVDRVSRLYGADPACICGQFNLSAPDCGKMSMWQIGNGGDRRPPPGGRQSSDIMTSVYEKVTFCMAEKPGPDDWMRMTFISRLYSTDAGCVCERMGVPADRCLNASVGDIVTMRGPAQDPAGVKDELRAAALGCGGNRGG